MAGKPRSVRVLSLKNQTLIADKTSVAERFFERLTGLIGRAGLEPGSGLLFPRCNSVHMWFMRFAIDVVFIRPAKRGANVWVVTSVRENVRPWKWLPILDWRASDALELPAGTIRRCALAAGDELCIN